MGRSLTGPGNIAKLGDTMIGPFNEARAPDLPSSTSVNLITTKGNLVDITGGTTILSMNLASGAERTLRFTGSLRLTNSASLVLPGGEDIITTPNDMAIVRGYPNGVVRFVSYSRAAGYVQRVGDRLSGTLTFASGNAVSPPIKFQSGGLTTLKVPHSFEWDGYKAYITAADYTRRELLYRDGDGSGLTSFSSKQITDALGYTPFDPNSSPNRISPNGGLLEAGQYIDMHYGGSNNDFDVRFELGVPYGGSGTSKLNIAASEVQVSGSKVWTAGNLSNLNQLANGPGYAPSANPVFTGQMMAPQGGPAAPGLIFGGEIAGDTGFYGMGDGGIGLSSNAIVVATFTSGGMYVRNNQGVTPGITFERNAGSTGISADFRLDTSGNLVRFFETGGGQRGAYLDISGCSNGASSKIITSDMMSSNISSGYQKLPSGLILQWGKRTNGGVGQYWVNFPITFPSVLVSLQTTYIAPDAKGECRGASGATTAGALIPTDNCDTWWFAIGY